VADYLNISSLINSLALFIAIRLANFGSVKIKNYLYNKLVPKQIVEKIFFLILNRKFLITNEKFGYLDESMSKINYNRFFYHKFYTLSNNSMISYDIFRLFYSLNGNFILYEKNQSIESFLFKKAKLNLDFDKSFILKYFDKYLDHAFIAGGIFSSNNTQHIFSQKYSNLKNLLIKSGLRYFFCSKRKKKL
jgi:hypothetical protein